MLLQVDSPHSHAVEPLLASLVDCFELHGVSRYPSDFVAAEPQQLQSAAMVSQHGVGVKQVANQQCTSYRTHRTWQPQRSRVRVGTRHADPWDK